MDLNFQPGDYVRLRLALKEIEGRVLESGDSSILLLKFDSGYNVGIPKENILGGRVLKKFKKEDKEKFELPLKKELPNIGMIITGGTIASKLDSKTGAVAALTDAGEFSRFYPEMLEIANIKKMEIPFMLLSENMEPEYWRKIAEAAERMLNDDDISGVIVTHGTDTLHYTSAALSFFLKNLNKPVVLTFSQRSIDRGSSDANLNLQCAARMAISDSAEVMIVGHSSTNDDYCIALRGTKVRKMHTSRRDAFKPVNNEPIAKVWPEKVEFISKYKARSEGKVELDLEFSDKVGLIKYYPGQEPDILDYYALKHKGVIIEGTGFGHVAGATASNSWIPKLKKHIREGLIVCMTSQCIFGKTNEFVYSNGREIADAGAIYLEDMQAEVALIKLGWVLGHHGWKAKVKEKMLENVAGEINLRLGVNNDDM